MAVSLLARLAAGARVPVYVLLGDGGRALARRLALDRRLRPVASPRHATVLLIAGDLPRVHYAVAHVVHDQVPTPRGVVLWGGDPEREPPFPVAAQVAGDDDPAPALAGLHRDLLTGARASAPTVGRHDNPVQWQGVGPHGQGGEGMMGGKPYGRPMAMTGHDLRDGLQLDPMTFTAGPFLPWLPAGLSLDVTLQGDVVQSLTPRVAALTRPDLPDAFLRAAREPVPVADLEHARARHHLGAVADLLWLHGLDALAERTLRLPADADRVRKLARTLRRTGALRLGTHGVGALPAEGLSGMGPAARAAGLEEDARLDDPAYRDLGLRPVTHEAGDAEALWRQRLAEAAQALELAGRAGDRVREPGPTLEGPRGPLDGEERPWLDRLSRVAVGQAWDELATTVVSLDLDPASLSPTAHEEV